MLSPGPHFVAFEVARGAERFACKRLSTRWLRDAEAQARLRSEARVLEALAGRAAPALVEHGSDAHGPYLVTRWVPWPTLEPRIGAPGLDLATLARRSFDALATVHEAGDASGPLEIVHGDLRPGNVAAAPDASGVVLLDFGLALWRGQPGGAAGAFRGTLLYAAPEAARGEAIGARADLFSLAATLLHVASGKPPRTSSSEASLLVAAGSEPLDGWAAEASRTLEAKTARALTACLSYQAEERPASARDVVAALC